MPASITLLPHEGVEFTEPMGQGIIRFGDDETAVRAVLGEPESRQPDAFAYHEARVQVHFSNGVVAFVEFAADPTRGGVDVELDGTTLSRLGVLACIDFLRTVNGDAAIEDSEGPASLVFQGPGVTVWQSNALEDAQAELQAGREAGADAEELRFLEEEVERAAHFESIGIGSQEYIASYF